MHRCVERCTYLLSCGQRFLYHGSDHAGGTKPFPKLTAPNSGLTGSFTIKPDYKSIAILDAASATVKTSFNANLASTNAAHFTIGVTYTDDPHNYEIGIFDAQGKPGILSPAQIRSYEWAFTDYKFAVLSNDQSRMALLGRVPDRYGPNFSYTPGYYAIGVFDNKGKQPGSLPINPGFSQTDGWCIRQTRVA